jgi:hypothetical protein
MKYPKLAWSSDIFMCGLTPRLTGAGARSAQGTNTGHKNGEAMASVGVRVEPPVRLGRIGAVVVVHQTLSYLCRRVMGFNKFEHMKIRIEWLAHARFGWIWLCCTS